jgi:fluoride ion exporter CrcB/FEX
MRRIILIALGGGLGSIARLLIVLWLKPFHFWEPSSILLINFSGSFFIAIVNFLSEPIGPVSRSRLGIRSREFLMVGICGFSPLSVLFVIGVGNGVCQSEEENRPAPLVGADNSYLT